MVDELARWRMQSANKFGVICAKGNRFISAYHSEHPWIGIRLTTNVLPTDSSTINEYRIQLFYLNGATALNENTRHVFENSARCPPFIEYVNGKQIATIGNAPVLKKEDAAILEKVKQHALRAFEGIVTEPNALPAPKPGRKNYD